MENNLHKLKKTFKNLEKTYGEEFEEISNFIFMNPELSGFEFASSAYLADYMKNHGFSVDTGYCGYETALRAEFILGNGDGPTIAFLAEYDALPVADSNNITSIKRTVPGHSCGHNWISAATAGVCVTLSKSEGINGKVVLIGTPAEETIGSKVDMIKQGAFEDIDIVMQPHLESFTDINCTALASDAIEFRFYGKATHAASYPHKGINALDAVQLMFSGVNAMRQQLRDDAKICGIVCSGGEAPNIIPDYASAKYSIRAADRNYLNEVTQRVVNCARGAELMTNASMQYEYFENPTDDILNVKTLQNMLKENMIEEGINNIGDTAVMPTGSSDIGNVSQVCPTMYFEIDIEADKPFYTHSEIALEYVNSDYAYRKLHQVIRIMGNISLELYEDKQLVESIKKEHLMSRSINSI